MEHGDEQEIIDQFHILWYEKRQRQTWRNTTWMGIELQQCPLDLWVYQELIHRTRPEVFVEIGIKRGGLTRYIADVFDLMHGTNVDDGRVVGVDVATKHAERAVGEHPRVTLIEGSSTSTVTFEHVKAACRGKPAMVLLDSDHTRDHVRAELELYNTLVGVGGYLIVNDTNMSGHPVLAWKEPGPYEAVEDFLAGNARFEIDLNCEKHMLTQCPHGYLRRVA